MKQVILVSLLSGLLGGLIGQSFMAGEVVTAKGLPHYGGATKHELVKSVTLVNDDGAIVGGFSTNPKDGIPHFGIINPNDPDNRIVMGFDGDGLPVLKLLSSKNKVNIGILKSGPMINLVDTASGEANLHIVNNEGAGFSLHSSAGPFVFIGVAQNMAKITIHDEKEVTEGLGEKVVLGILGNTGKLILRDQDGKSLNIEGAHADVWKNMVLKEYAQ